MSLRIKKPGILTTIQDLGRVGSRRHGVNVGGAMDRAAVRIINTLLDNSEPAPVLEAHFPAPVIEFESDTTFALGGADFEAEIDGASLRNWSTASAAKGSVLSFGKRISGGRCYVAVKGGLQADEWLGSASTNLAVGIGGFGGRRLLAGDLIECRGGSVDKKLAAAGSMIPRYSRFPTVRIVPGPEFDLLTAPCEKSLVTDGFTLTRDCDRMGFRLSGRALHLLHRREMVSAGVAFGTIQLLPDGQLIMLMADHQTSGGYPRIANVISADLPLVAQLLPGDGVSFQIASIEDAERLALRFERELNFLRVGCRLQTL